MASSPARPQRHHSVPPRSETNGVSEDAFLRDLLASQLKSVAEAVLEQDAALHELRCEVRQQSTEAGGGPSDIGKMYTEENAALARHTQEGFAEAAALASANGALTGEAEVSRQKVKELRAELDLLRARVGAAEQLTDGARRASELAEKNLDAERRKGADWFQKIEAEINLRSARITESERAIAEACCQTSRLEIELQSVQEDEWRHAETEARTEDEARTDASTLRATVEEMEAELSASEQKEEETERKIHCIGREISETSEAIKQLRAEAEGHRDLRMELDQARREEGYLEQRLRRVFPLPASGQQPGKSSVLPAASQNGTASSSSHAKRSKLKEEYALQEALRTAWESEARDKRLVELELQAREAEWKPLRQWFLRLSSTLRRHESELACNGVPMSQLPSDDAWDDLAQVPAALASLCDCVEVLAGAAYGGVEDGAPFPHLGQVGMIDALVGRSDAGAWQTAGDVSSLSPSSPALSRGYR